MITDQIFQAFLKCETKGFFKDAGDIGDQREFSDWERDVADDYRRESCDELLSHFQEDECITGASVREALSNSKYRLAIDSIVETSEFQLHIQALELLSRPGKGEPHECVPIRFMPKEKVTRNDKLILAFDAFVLSTLSHHTPQFGKIVHGRARRTLRVELGELSKEVQSIAGRILKQQASRTRPQLVLNRHCPECEYCAKCRGIAIKDDELSLISGMTDKERKELHTKGIFTVTQLSYTFRPRRKPKCLALKPEKHSHALRALAIRENRIYIAGKPELRIEGNVNSRWKWSTHDRMV